MEQILLCDYELERLRIINMNVSLASLFVNMSEKRRD